MRGQIESLFKKKNTISKRKQIKKGMKRKRVL
jgi:hypothetical protein